MAEFVNKVVKNGSEWDIQDARIPEALSEDAGKVLKVADEGGYELGEAGGDASSVIVISGDLHIGSGSTMQDIFDANIGIEEPAQFTSVVYDVYFENSIYYDPGMSQGAAQIQITTYGSIQVYIRFSYRKSGNDWVEPTINLTDYTTTFGNGTFSLENAVRGLPDASTAGGGSDSNGDKSISVLVSGGGPYQYTYGLVKKVTFVSDFDAFPAGKAVFYKGQGLGNLYYVTTQYCGSNVTGTIVDLAEGKIGSIAYDSLPSDVSGLLSHVTWTSNFNVPVLPNDASSKTYVLKAINGALEWVEE